MGFRNLMKLCMAAQVPPSNSLAQVLASLKSAECLAQVSYKPEADFKNNITAYYRLGERPVGIVPNRPMPGGLSAAAPAAPPGGAPGPGPAPSPAPAAVR